ncbi:MAG: GNAT family N-acetyltransferase [Proteobacteria bacterium]|nr:GNAT family N-acetyltransferase [Pseudomonadota bacterium]
MTGADAAVAECRFGAQRFIIRDIVPGDAEAVIALFNVVFEQRIPRAWFEWKYGPGKGVAVGMWDEDGRLVAHYAGIPRLLAWQDRTVHGLQIGDVMVTPELRGIMTRKGPFQQVCSHFFARRVGPNLSYRIAFGFPNQRALRLGTTLGLYRDAGIIKLLRWPARRVSLPFWLSRSTLGESETIGDRQMRTVWASMQRDFRDFVLGIRDADYLRWRFIARPDRQYKLFVLRNRLTGTALAIFVMRLAGESAELLDVIGPRSAFPAVVGAARDEAARFGANSLTAWASPAAAAIFGNSGAEEIEELPSGAFMAVARPEDYSAAEIAATRWWWMGGDTDFL